MKENPKQQLSDYTSLLKPNLIIFSLFFFCTLTFSLFTLKSLFSPLSLSPSCPTLTTHLSIVPEPEPKPDPTQEETGLQHIVFGIGAASRHWVRRKQYVKLWWRPGTSRGYAWLDKSLNLSTYNDDMHDYPEIRISSDTTRFYYTHGKGDRSALRMTRIVSEMVRINKVDNVRWYVMVDDDTVVFQDNLARVLRKYDHTKMYYIGGNSETHIQNVLFSYGMAYGGGGFAISYPLAKVIEGMQDGCIQRYPDLYGSDDRIQACLAEIGVPLTREPGFHQFDVYGNLFGLLAAHPVAPLVTMHHLELLDPIFPKMSRLQALERLKQPEKLDSAGLMQQSICYDIARNWTLSVSWGYVVQVIRGVIAPREMELPPRTFLNWYKKEGPAGFSINTRPLTKHPCQKPFVYYLSHSEIRVDLDTNVTRTDYLQHAMPRPWCWWTLPNPELIRRVEVFKKSDPYKWHEAPRRDCCRVMPTEKESTMVIEVGKCQDEEITEPPEV